MVKKEHAKVILDDFQNNESADLNFCGQQPHISHSLMTLCFVVYYIHTDFALAVGHRER